MTPLGIGALVAFAIVAFVGYSIMNMGSKCSREEEKRMIVTEKKHEVWNHFIERWALGKGGGGHGITGPRLRTAKAILWKDATFWDDVVFCHGLTWVTPEQLKEHNRSLYDHCLGNFWGMIHLALVERGVIKP